MKTSPAGRGAIEGSEGLRLKAYLDSVGVLTIGFGHTSMAGAPFVTAGLTITREEASDILARDLGKYEDAVVRGLKRAVSQNAFDAMVSLCYNVGPGNFAKSSVLRLVNAGDLKGAADAFLVWNRAGGQALPGLTRRRQAERARFLTPDAPQPVVPPASAIVEHATATAASLAGAVPVPQPKPDPQPGFFARLLGMANRPAA